IKAASIASKIARLRSPLQIVRSRRPDAMREKRRNGRATAKTSIQDEIAHLRGLDLKGLRARWQSVLQRPAPGARSGSQRTQHSDQGKTARDGRDARWHPVRPWRAVLFVG